jgi:PIN domain nuclease of toxin-antitoxin system
VRALIEDPANDVLVSAANVWEIAIKDALGRGDMPISGDQALDWFRQAGYALKAEVRHARFTLNHHLGTDQPCR